MKIVHLCISAFYCDNFSYQENIITKYHVKQGHDVTIIASLFSFSQKGEGIYLKPSEYVNNDGVKVIRLPYKKPFPWFNRLLRRYEGLGNHLESEKPDVIFSHNISTADMKVLASYLRKHPEVILFADNHADYINSGKNFLSKIILHRIIWRHYAQIIEPYIRKCYGVTPMRCRFLTEMYHIPKEKVEFLPMGIDDESIPQNRDSVRKAIRTELGIPENSMVIITGGKIDKLKNTHILVDALSTISIHHIHLIICGVLTPEMDYLKDIIDNNKHIHYLGWCDASRVISCMVASDFACFPGTHSTLWEQSVGMGMPAIFNHWYEMDHVNINGNCIFVDGNDKNELMKAIESMVTNYSLLKEKAEGASKSFLYSDISQRAISD